MVMAEPQVGEMAPEFELPGEGGAVLRLADSRGKLVVLYFYPKDNTPACTQEALDFSLRRKQFAKAKAVVIGISPDSPKRHAGFARKHGLDIALGSDSQLTAANAYGVWGEKMMFGRKYMGIKRTTFLIGRDGRILRVWNNVKVNGHADEVLEAARSA